ncbi:hypothetical protein MKQ70_26345 [Chitinophaga sedimenti]|uniref:hypothetical protein n=1 Tax=Chitinophaga sedimenti TaxID=2033606 RepID=UPI002004AA67|nr:hypothetical protein [Chitinophaga sedimenti]MCK7558331.1 hypothetical protein [Chitinophaga sedimenti]
MALDERKYTTIQTFLLNFLSLLTLLPMAPYINRFIPPIKLGTLHIDLFLSILTAFLFTRLLLWIFKPLIIPAFVLVFGVLVINLFRDSYSFGNVLNDYKGMVQGNWGSRDNKQLDILSFYPRKVETYRDKTVKGIRAKMTYKDSVVRNFAVQHSLDYFDDYFPKYGKIVRYLSLYKYIRQNFKYVNDVLRDEYFATPQETIQNGLGATATTTLF